MHAEITHAKDKELEFRILDVDISILYIVQQELQRNNDILKHVSYKLNERSHC